MYKREVCEYCGEEITAGSIFETEIGNLCEECFLDWACHEVSNETWEKYSSSAERLADFMDVYHEDVENFLNNKEALLQEAKWESYNDR